jgi:hypothetical protein
MNENDLTGDVIGVGSSMSPEGIEKQIAALHAAYVRNTNADEALQELMQSQPDVAEFSRYTVTLRMDSEYTTFTELINGKSPDVSPPDTLTATWHDRSVDIPVTFWSLHNHSRLGFMLDIDGKRQCYVLQSKSWQSKVIDKTQLELPWTLEGEVEQDDEGRVIKADLRGKITDLPTVPVDMHLMGDHESGITLFSMESLQRILKRNRLLKFTAPPSGNDSPDYASPGRDVIANNPLELVGRYTGTPHNERESVIQTKGVSIPVELQIMSVPGYDQQLLFDIVKHSSVNADIIFNATVGQLIQSGQVMAVFKLDDICKAVSQPEWKRANADDRRTLRIDTLHTLLFGSWTRLGKDILSIVTVDAVHLNESNEPESVTLSIPRLMEQKMIQRRGQNPQLESEYSRTHFSAGTLEGIGYLPGGTETSRGHNSYARGIAFWMGQHEAISRGAERTFIRQQMLSDITIRPTLKHSLSDKTHKTRIVEYYCKALHSLLDVPEGADQVQILPYGDAEIVREHKKPYMTLKAWTDYESLNGTNRVEQWLKQKGVLRPASVERSAIADDLRKRVEIRAKIGKQSAERARRAAEKKADRKR